MNILIFTVNDKFFGLDIGQVREVIRMRKITQVPDAGESIEGVINLRRKVVTIINLQKKLGLSDINKSRSNRIIILSAKNCAIGVIVESVDEVVKIDPESISTPDEYLKKSKHLVGVARAKNNLIPILDVLHLLSDDEKVDIEKVHEKIEIQ